MHPNKFFWWSALIGITTLMLWLQYGDNLMLGIWISVFFWIIWSFTVTKTSVNKIEVLRLSKIKRQQVGSYFNERIKVINHSSFKKLWIELSKRLLKK